MIGSYFFYPSPRVFTSSFLSTGKDIKAYDISVAAGLYLKGTINFLGFEVSAEINVNPGEKILVDIQMSPIDWAGGLMVLRKNATDLANGPKAFIHLEGDTVIVKIEGYISLLGASGAVVIDVSDAAYKFKLDTDLWGMIRSNLEVEASYGSLATLDFKVGTWFI